MRRTAGQLGALTLLTTIIVFGAVDPAAAAAFSDNFNRANGTDLGPGWAETGTDLVLNANKLTNSSNTAGFAQAVGGTGAIVEADIVVDPAATTQYAALALDVTSASSTAFVEARDSTADATRSFDRIEFFTQNNAGSVASVPISGFISGHLRLQQSGSTVTALVNTDGDPTNEIVVSHTYTSLPPGTGIGVGVNGGATIDDVASSTASVTSTALTSSANPATVGQSVTFTATVSAATGTPTGSLVFTVDGNAESPITLAGGQAQLITASLTLGTHEVSAAYTPNSATFSNSSSSILDEIVQPPPRPDARIRRGNQALVGNDVYNSTGVDQTAQGAAAVGHTVTYTVSLQNDSAVAEGVTVQGQGSTAHFGVVYRSSSGANITSQVVAGTYRPGTTAPGAARTITAVVTVKSGTPHGASATRKVTVTSRRDAAVRDAVRFVTRRP